MEPASIQSKLKELANLLMKEDLEKEYIEIAREIASEIDSDTVYVDKRKMKEEFLRLTFGYDIDKKISLSSLPIMVDGIFYLRDMVNVYSVKEIVKKYPQVLGYSIDKMNRKVKYLESLGVNNVGKVVENCPQVLGYSIDKMNRKVKYLESLGVNKNKIGKVVENFPQVLGYSIDKMKRNVEYLESLGVDNVGKVVEKYPSVLGSYSIDKMNENVEYLESLGVDNVGKVVENCPQVLGYSIDKMNRKVKYLESLGVNNVGKVVENCPQVLGLSIDKMNRKVKYLESLGVNNVGKVVEKYPSVLGYSIDNMNRKLSYYQIYFPTVEFIKNEPVHLLEKDPSLLGRSLYKKIIPRLRYVSSKIGGDIKKYGLNISSLMNCNDDKFILKLQKKGIAADIKEYNKLLGHYKQIDDLDIDRRDN